MLGKDSDRHGRRRGLCALAPFAVSLIFYGTDPLSASEVSIEEVLHKAFSSSFVIGSAIATLQAEKARLDQALSERSFDVSLKSRYQGVHTRDGNASTDKVTGQLFVEATQSLYDDGRVSARISEAEARVAAAVARVQLAEQQLLMSAMETYIRILEGERLLELAEANRRTLESELTAARNRFELGAGTRTSVAQAESRLAEAESVVAQRVGELEVSRSRYQTAVGEPPPEILVEIAVLPDLPTSLSMAQETADREHPELVAARADQHVAEHALRRVSALEPGQGLSVFGSAGATYDSGRGNPQRGIRRMRPELSAGVVFSVPLYDGGGKEAQKFEAEQIIASRRFATARLEAAIREEVVSAWESLILAESVIESGMTRTDAAALALEGVRRAAQGGQASTLDVLDGERELLNAETGLVQANFSRLIAAFRLRAAVGSLTLEGLGL